MPPQASLPSPAVKATYRSDVAPAVVLADGTACREFDVLQRLLEAQHVPVVRIGHTADRVLTASVTGQDGGLLIDGRPIQPIVAWSRHATAAAIHLQLVHSGAGSAVLQAQCWSRLLEAIAAVAATALPGGNPGLSTQLRDAARLGVRVPRTVVTTDLDAAKHRFAGAQVIAKIPDSRPLAPAPGAGGLLPVAQAAGAPALDTWPVVVQEYVEHVRELRVYHTGGAITAFEVRKPRPDSIWTEPEAVTVTVASCPPRLAGIVRRLAAAWQLHYGAFDFLITRSGEPCFLEVNTDGDWLWFERKAEWRGVSFMVAAMIAELYARNTRPKGGVRWRS